MNATLFTELLEKEMTRKEFLLHVGLLFLAITGITGLIKHSATHTWDATMLSSS